MAATELAVRPATHDDFDAVAAFTEDTWADRGHGDYIPRVYHDWIEKDDAATLLADAGDEVAGIAQAVLLSEHEAWCQGMRVNPAFRGEGVSVLVNDALFEWARDRGATVARNMVFSWNAPALGASRAAGFDPCTEFRWATPDPDPDADPAPEVTGNPDAAWSYWSASDARDHLRGLALSPDESWAMQELTRDILRRAADDARVFAVQDDGTQAMAFRVRDYERSESSSDDSENRTESGGSDDGDVERRVEYGVGAWDGVDSADALFDAIRRDAGELGADRTRVLIPETARFVSDASYVRAGVSDEPDFVLSTDLTAL